ncbi:MAG TPA: hypothetical protein PKY25_02140 [Bacilli bacterium]|nr:hypothetical protein [Bacilli bacterium]
MKKIISKLLVGIFIFLIGINEVFAATGTITISGVSSTTIGNTISVTVRASASKIFYCQLFTTYDTTRLRLTSGSTTIQYEADDIINGVSSVSRTYKFKAIKTGTAYVKVTSGGTGMNINTSNQGIVYATKTKNITISNPVPKSTNNYLSALLVENATLTPTFNKSTLAYSVSLEPLTTSINIRTALEDSKARVTGGGVVSLIEGLNTINLVVTAESGAKRTYIISATVQEQTPVIVKINNENYTVIRKKGLYEAPLNFEETTVKINNEDVLAYTNKKLNLTVLGLKDSKEVIKLYIYDGKKYEEYKSITINGLNLYLKDISNSILPKYEKVSIKIGNTSINALSFNNSNNNYLIKGVNTSTGKENIYSYDKKNNTLQIYYEDYNNSLLKEIDNYKLICIGLFSVSIILLFVLIMFAFKKKKVKKHKKETE